MTKIEIWTDGSCVGNGTPDAVGGWGLVIVRDDIRLIENSGGPAPGDMGIPTNNRMEMQAIIEALKYCEGHTLDVTIKSDSNLVVATVNQFWKKKSNLDLWAELEGVLKLARKTCSVEIIWVKAHVGDKWNEVADRLAYSASHPEESK